MIGLEDFNPFDFIPPNVVTFFRPEVAFLDWFVDHINGRLTLEVGAGQCEFAKALVQLGVKLLAIEPRPSPEVMDECHNFLLPLAAEKVNMLKAPFSVIVAARPDHSGWFPKLTDMVHSGSELLYIGLEKNIEQDIPDYRYTEELYRDAGEDGEVVLRITRS